MLPCKCNLQEANQLGWWINRGIEKLTECVYSLPPAELVYKDKYSGKKVPMMHDYSILEECIVHEGVLMNSLEQNSKMVEENI